MVARRGVTMPFIVFLMATFIGMTAFAVDISRMHVIRAQLQTAADAGAMAGAVQLLDNANRAATPDSARAYALRNPVEDTIPTVADADIVPGHWYLATRTFTPTGSYTDPTTNAVQVTTHHIGGYFFGPIYDVFTSPIGAHAVGTISPVRTTNCMAPLALPYEQLLRDLFPVGDVRRDSLKYDLVPADIDELSLGLHDDTLKIGPDGNVIASGQFYAVDVPVMQGADGTMNPYGSPISGAKAYEALLSDVCGDFPGIVSRGDWLRGEGGNMQGPTRKGIAARCNATGTNFVCDPPADFVVPVWDFWQQMPGGKGFHVKYLAGYKVTKYENNNIIGFFHTMKTSGTLDTLPSPLIRAVLVR